MRHVPLRLGHGLRVAAVHGALTLPPAALRLRRDVEHDLLPLPDDKHLAWWHERRIGDRDAVEAATRHVPSPSVLGADLDDLTLLSANGDL